MSFVAVAEPPVHLTTVAQELFDVSSAGDTGVAVIAAAAAIAALLPVRTGIRMVNQGAGVVVAKRGTAAITRDDLAACSQEMVAFWRTRKANC